MGSSAAAVAAAAHKMLVLLYPGQQSRLDTFYTDYLTASLIDPLDPGIAVGEAAAIALHTNHYRPNDIPFVPFIGEVATGKWRTPPTQPMAFQILTVTVRPCQPRCGRRGDRRVGCQVVLQLLAPQHGYPGGRR